MSIRFTTTARRGMAAAAIAVSLALGVAGCSSGDDKSGDTSTSASKNGSSNPDAQTGDSEEPLAELKGEEGFLLTVTSAVRDSGGFLTVSGELKNDGDQSARVPVSTRGDETEIIKHGTSFGGSTLVDSSGKKRYYVLRDTEGRPLTTTDLPKIKAGDSIPVFIQFPAPPKSTTEVTFQVPTFAAATIKISG
ncbi:hypothetical protein [Streptomyces sp. HD]|uniref:hypothetical protein n=1 Tax=Streptomyces sp. HD TaxID=3020892 RepID=UPI00232D342B|nr:hypothetical protein [Streptomyces sp. HD]MDC0773963.1 hypothetical protein [Streptomyces sp. HD]